MRLRSALTAAIAACVTVAILATPAVAVLKLTVPDAAERSARHARRTCEHDRRCVRNGVLNCRRQSLHVVLCRIFDERRTRVQGRYRCERLVRISLEPSTHRRRVTGLGAWNC